MLITIQQFRDRVRGDSAGLVADLQALTGRYGADEAKAWKESLGKLSRVFQARSFQPLHLYFGSRGNLALEYQLPASSSWCDVVLLGAHKSQPAAVLIELKDWITRGDKPGRYEGLIERQGAQELHPSDQVRGYTEYCRWFHSAVLGHHASVHGCVVFTRDRWAEAYSAPPNDRLAEKYPLFTDSPDDVQESLPQFFGQRLTAPDPAFAHAFSEGVYKQNRGFISQIGAQILDPTSRTFELLDNQRKAFARCQAVVLESFKTRRKKAPKRVIILEGPPGSGKSVIAARLWASLVTDADLPDGDVVFTTTSMSQNRNWAELFRQASGSTWAGGIVRKATTYSPITTQRIGQLRSKFGQHFLSSDTDWRKNLRTLQVRGEPFRDGARDNQNLVSIVDEAHALINTEHSEGRGQFGFPPSLGPQAYHIIRSSLLTVFLLDPLQGFRQRENTSVDDIRCWSQELGGGEPEIVSLEGMQFRCAGSTEYVQWVESVLRGRPTSENRRLTSSWHRSTTRKNALMDVRVFDNPESWEDELRSRVKRGNSARLLSTYSRRWVTAGVKIPHALSADEMDFHERYKVNGNTKYWSRIWNFVPGNDYTWFVAGRPGSYIADDPLSEVGCPYAVRGFDYDYVGILWLNDLVYRNGEMRVDPFAVEESGVAPLTRKARAEAQAKGPGTAIRELQERVAQAYRILFTRALKGVYVWVPDRGTREYLVESLNTAAP